ncbi:MAG: DUF434 domain-containing protein [Bacillota bacterium]
MITSVTRGYSPKDKTEFGEAWRERMAAAAEDVRYLLSRGYDISAAVTFVGNRFQLSSRQRMALTRGVTSRRQCTARREKELSSLSGVVYIDGFNTVITLEVALSGSLLLRCDDGTIRDIAGLHGSYRIVDKTPRAVELMLDELDAQGIDGVIVYLDQPVSNSGRLKSLIAELGAGRRYEVSAELLTDVDGELNDKPQVVTSDGVILDACGGWYNLNRRIIEKCIREAWIYPI